MPTRPSTVVAALYAIPHVPRVQNGRLFADVFRRLVPGWLVLATSRASDSLDRLGPWLGEVMFFSGYGADDNRRLLRAAVFELLLDDVL